MNIEKAEEIVSQTIIPNQTSDNAINSDISKQKNPRSLTKFYTGGEEVLNIVTHLLGALFGVFVLVYGVLKCAESRVAFGILAAVL
jgi:predicted membrane channel-forming protein YqfA (hemolysin III family)